MIYVDGCTLGISDVVRCAREGERVELDGAAMERILKAERAVDRLVRGHRTVYGVNTGFGELAKVRIEDDRLVQLQENLIRSHAAGVGEPLPEEVVRGSLLLRANALAKGLSGVRLSTVELLIEMLNRGVHPWMPAQGSVGASGDLAPLAHMALVLMGEGRATYRGQVLPGDEALRRAGLEPIRLAPKEGLALTNGTQVMTSLAALAVWDAMNLIKCAQTASAMSLEALMGTRRAFDPRIHEARPHPGQMSCARNILRLTEGSAIAESHKGCGRVQDAYTLRCMPQVYGASRDAIDYARRVVEIEINSATDNPLVFPETDEVISGGNFHGQPVAVAMDLLGIALSEIGDISERTSDRLVNPHLSGLPPFLAEESGLNSGYMIAQYTAAALVSENKVLAHPACVDSIPTSAGQEDHVSMGTIAARKARAILDNVTNIVAIELILAAQGIDFLAPTAPGKGTGAAHRLVRSVVPHLGRDRPVHADIEAAADLIRSGALVRAVEGAIGEME